MKRKDRLPELLAPAGSFECLVAAVEAGADAVYVGGRAYGARAFAKNFDEEELSRAVSYCHFFGVKLYVTVNTLLEDGELEGAVNFARALYEMGVDALIVCDLGLIKALRLALPDFELHASTQMSVHNSLGADVAYSLGCKRVVLARELCGKDIKEVTDRCLAETEVFLHGALCVSHSGQCLFSSLVGGRSGNRGECAQPCRLPYFGGDYPLSLKDLALSGHVRELIDSGVASLKIEGRMKSPDYVFTVTSIYRALLDSGRDATSIEEDRLAAAFTRGGFTDGYFTGRFGKMTGIRSEEDKRQSREASGREFRISKTPVKAYVEIKKDRPSLMRLDFLDGREAPGNDLTVYGQTPSPAISSPLKEDEVKERLSRMGNTLLSLKGEDVTLLLDEGLNLPPSALNALRREAAERLEGSWRRRADEEAFRAAGAELYTHEEKTVALGGDSAEFYSGELLKGVDPLTLAFFARIFLPLREYEAGIGANGVALPAVIMEGELSSVGLRLREAKEKGALYALVGNLGHIPLVKDAGLIPVFGFRMNLTNTLAKIAQLELGAEDVILSAELTAKSAGRVGGRAIVYGRIPLMITERCFVKDTFGCEWCQNASLKDRRGYEFPMVREEGHRTVILNSAVTYMGDKLDTLPTIKGYGAHFIFTKESPAEVERVVKAFKKKEPFPLKCQFRRMGRRQEKK